jgi:selenocysteine-specific elongation factor
MVTIGGGQVVEPISPQRRRRKVSSEIQRLERKAANEQDYVAGLIEENPTGVSLREIAQRLFVTKEQVRKVVDSLIFSGEAILLDNQAVVSSSFVSQLFNKMVSQLQHHHAERPLRRGMPKEQLRVALSVPGEVFEQLLQKFAQSGEIVLDKELIRLPSHEIRLTDEHREWAQRMEQKVKVAGFAPPELDELLAEFPYREQALDLLALLVEQGKLVKVAEFVLHPDTIGRAKQVVRQLCERHGSFTASQFREAINTTRKYAIPLLEFLDQIGVTVRRGDVRVLKRGGKKGD